MLPKQREAETFLLRSWYVLSMQAGCGASVSLFPDSVHQISFPLATVLGGSKFIMLLEMATSKARPNTNMVSLWAK